MVKTIIVLFMIPPLKEFAFPAFIVVAAPALVYMPPAKLIAAMARALREQGVSTRKLCRVREPSLKRRARREKAEDAERGGHTPHCPGLTTRKELATADVRGSGGQIPLDHRGFIIGTRLRHGGGRRRRTIGGAEICEQCQDLFGLIRCEDRRPGALERIVQLAERIRRLPGAALPSSFLLECGDGEHADQEHGCRCC
jgi:hypothetical protein